MMLRLLFWNVSTEQLVVMINEQLMTCFTACIVALGVAHQALEEINPAGDDILIQGE